MQDSTRLNRTGWEAQFLDREARLIEEFSRARTFLVVLTADNWAGFGDHANLGKKYFLLSDTWPSAIPFDRLQDAVVTPVELLLGEVVKIGKTRTSSG